jgi:ABC-type lipoprotein export system ATPase subunit
VENAGIHRTRAVQLLRQRRKIFIFVTHDPRIALLSDFRIVMQRGSITNVLSTSDEERSVSVRVNRLDDALSSLRDKLRNGLRLTAAELKEVA